MNVDRTWRDWPVCPQCGRLRQTVCPTCGGAGIQFPVAEYQADAEPQRGSRPSTVRETPSPDPTDGTLLMCPRCDEAFMPRFYRICPACGNDAGEGVELEDRPGEQVSRRVLLAVYGLAAVAVLMLIYFWSLFRGQ